MESQETNQGNVISSLDSNMKIISKSWQKIKKLHIDWDIINLQSNLDIFNSELEKFNLNTSTFNNYISENIQNINNKIGGSEYINTLETNLKELNIPFIGNFPEYDIPPYKLTISKENKEARLFFGRKSEKTNSLNPNCISDWVNTKYKKIISRKMDLNALMKELFEAYQIINKLTYREKTPIWGKAVKLTEIYNLLTLKRTTKQEYPKQFYQHELGLLKENLDMSFNNYRFEFGFARDISKAIQIVDNKGKISHVSSLTIYKED